MNEDYLIKSFENYYQQVYEDLSFRVNVESNQKAIDNFFKILKKNGIESHQIGDHFINKFLLFQFEYWMDKDLKSKPSITWFIGKKAIERFLSVENWGQKEYFVGLATLNLTPLKSKKHESEYEIKQKELYHNQEEGFFHCIANTTLYSKCITCIRCKFKNECQALLKQNYPLLYRRRLKNDR